MTRKILMVFLLINFSLESYGNNVDSCLYVLNTSVNDLKNNLQTVNNSLNLITELHLNEVNKKKININNVIANMISITALILTSINIRKQLQFSEKLSLQNHYRNWNISMINYTSELINEIIKNRQVYDNTILVGRVVSENQIILEIKIELLLDISIPQQKELLNTVKLYTKNKSGSRFEVSKWLESIKEETKKTISSKI